ncbi:elongation factor EF-2 [Candidatus Woesearchaeota archaeon]|nr:elongation factor EF-2 [Candidatus Woesearchaeota archaeon]
MASEKMIDKMMRMIHKPSNIRNICTSAHIHHGKTAFTDNLLAAAGLMSVESAGELEKGMATWQHADEQERLMTVDAANVSMVHEFHGQEFLINLIDTPGHVDFGGNVTRAMRAIDGTVVLVCASEGIMPQTETVLRQALRERVKPVLFINKVDRLIKELQMTPQQIQERFTKIIVEFNRLVEEIAETEFKEKWKVNITDGSVAFGSARDNWALSLAFMKKKNVGFKDILSIYEMPKEEREKWVWEHAPLSEVILDMVISHLPNPMEAQKYRISRIWRGDFETQLGKDLVSCNPQGKLAFCITRILIDPRSGREICAGRLYSGTITEGMQIYCNNAKQYQRLQNVYMYLGIKTESFTSVPAGNVLAIAGISASAGDTITTEPDQPFEELKHIFEPVITKSISVPKPQDLPKLVEVLRKVVKEDPSIKVDINEETGEVLLHGMGELHLEIIENRIKTEKGVDVVTSAPIVVYREAVTRVSPEVEGKSPNKHNKFYFIVEPLEDSIVKAIKKGDIPEGRVRKKDEIAMRDKFVAVGMDSKQAQKIKDIFNSNVFIDETKGQVHIGEVIEMILDMFEDVMKAGPLAREPAVNVKVRLMDMKLHEDAIHRGPAQTYPAVREGLKDAIRQAGAVMYEPLQILLIEAPVEHMGDVSKLVSNRRGQLLDMEQEGSQLNAHAKMPVAELFGWSSDLRSATGGRGISSLADQMFEKAPAEQQERIIRGIRDRKKLSEAQ